MVQMASEETQSLVLVLLVQLAGEEMWVHWVRVEMWVHWVRVEMWVHWVIVEMWAHWVDVAKRVLWVHVVLEEMNEVTRVTAVPLGLMEQQDD